MKKSAAKTGVKAKKRMKASAALPATRPLARPAPSTTTAASTTTTTTPRLPIADPAAWDATAFQSVLDAWMASKPSVGTVTVAIAGGGHEWTGMASRAAAGPAFQPDDRFGVLSITKTMTAALVLRAVEAGQLSFDGPVPEIVGLRTPQAPITVRQLLTHTSGLVDYARSPNYRAGQAMTPLDAVNLSTDFPLATPPGTTVAYANSNYLYLQLLLEQATGKPLSTLVGELAGELGLAGTTLEPPDRNGWIGGGSGGLRSTVGDLARWGAALFTPGRVLSEAMHRDFTVLDARGVGLGTWPICPCRTDAAGVHRYTALGHHTVAGALEHYPPTGLTVAVRIDPQSGQAGGFAAELGVRLSGLFATR